MKICFATTALRVSLSYKRSSIAKQKSADFDKRASRSKRTTCQLRTHTLVTLCAISLIVPALSANEPASTFCDWHHRGMVLLHAGNYPAAAQAFRQALALAKTSTSAVPDLIAIHTSLASAYTLEGRYVESRDEFHDALVLVEKGQGAHSLDYALIFASMALLPTDSDIQSKAIDLLRKAIAENANLESQKDLAVARDYLVKVLLNEKKCGDADLVLQDWQASFNAHKITDPELTAELWNDLAVLRHLQKRYGEALDLDVQAVSLLRKTLGDEHPALIVPLTNLAILYTQLDCLNEADTTFDEAAEICEKTLGTNHRDYASILANHGVVLKKLGRKRESKRMEAQAHEILQASNRSNGVGATVSLAGLVSGDR